MGLEKQPGDAHRDPGPRQRSDLRAAPVGAVGPAAGALQAVRDIEQHRRQRLHQVHAEHVDHQVVVAETAAALAQQDAGVAGLGALGDDVPHLFWGEELRLLDIDNRPGPRHRDDKIGLAGEKRR